MNDPAPELEEVLAPLGFRRVKEGGHGRVCRVILKLQTLNLNRAVAVVDVDSLPEDPAPLLKKIRKEVAFRSGFFPFFYGIGTQLVLVVAGPTAAKIVPESFLDRYDNQWSIIQSVFIVRADSGLIAAARTWGQWITGRYQDAIESVLARRTKTEGNPSASTTPGTSARL